MAFGWDVRFDRFLSPGNRGNNFFLSEGVGYVGGLRRDWADRFLASEIWRPCSGDLGLPARAAAIFSFVRSALILR